METAFIAAFDLEGPLSPQDNAYEVIGRVEQGYELFERLSRYDDILTLAGHEGYEPGDTLMLLVPFLLAYGITEEDVRNVSARAGLVPGAGETAQTLQRRGVPVVIISTSYCQHAHSVAARIGVPAGRVACTSLPLTEMSERVTEEDRAFVLDFQRRLLAVPPAEEKEIDRICDVFFWSELPARPLGRLVEQVKVVGGARKTAALSYFSAEFEVGLDRVVAVGDSITDFKMLAAVDKAGGLAVVFNGNEYAIPYGTCGVAAADLRAVLPVTEAFFEGGREKAQRVVEELGGRSRSGDADPVYHWLAGRDTIDDVTAVHKEFRRMVRGRAAKLG